MTEVPKEGSEIEKTKKTAEFLTPEKVEEFGDALIIMQKSEIGKKALKELTPLLEQQRDEIDELIKRLEEMTPEEMGEIEI